MQQMVSRLICEERASGVGADTREEPTYQMVRVELMKWSWSITIQRSRS